jgi:hypothetical protein
MVTKEQALTESHFIQTGYFKCKTCLVNGVPMSIAIDDTVHAIDKPKNWRKNGKCKVWLRNPERFKLPIKYGMYSHGYIDETNCHLFEVAE